jgi:hypothetical protein
MARAMWVARVGCCRLYLYVLQVRQSDAVSSTNRPGATATTPHFTVTAMSYGQAAESGLMHGNHVGPL